MSSRRTTDSRPARTPLVARHLFITGTDTGVGKTLLTAMLVEHLRSAGVSALAMKPFCSGGRGDARLLHKLLGGELTLNEINPFFFSEPLAPFICARREGRAVLIADVLRAVRSIATRCDSLAVEGAGGLLTPLGEGFTLAKLISLFSCEVVVVARNRLGTINHTLLTISALCSQAGHSSGGKRARHGIRVLLMDQARSDFSAAFNLQCLKELLSPIEVLRMPYLGSGASKVQVVKENAKKFQKLLARISGTAIF